MMYKKIILHMKKTVSSLVIAISLMTPLSLAQTHAQESMSRFTDVSRTHDHVVAIEHFAEVGILKGYEDGTFQPDKIVNRAEALKVILSSANVSLPEELEGSPFSDVAADQWFAPYVIQAKNLGIVNGNPDGTFTPATTVNRVGFVKMLLETNRFKKDKWENQQYYADVPQDAWYSAYMNYAGKAGLISASSDGKLYPDKDLTRAEVAEILYLMKLILNGKQTQFLITQSEHQMAQIELYLNDKKVAQAKRASELAYDLTQQALANSPENNVVLAAAKIAKAYDLLVDAFIAGVKQDLEQARSLAELTKTKATEAWEADNSTQDIARHIKDRADEILAQL